MMSPTLARPGGARMDGPVLVTGGAGFIGTNLVARLLDAGVEVIVYDNLSRFGVSRNLHWLSRRANGRLGTCLEDTRDAAALRGAVQRAACVVHLATQPVAGQRFDDPVTDFETNLRGTFNLLESLRRLPQPPPLVLASSRRVYGAMPDIALANHGERCQPDDADTRLFGISEARPLDPASPAACSTAAADQYALAYARRFGVPATVLRLGCVYGPHQWGLEEDGWIAESMLQALHGRAVSVRGDGRQVRDLLYVDDAVDALLAAGEHHEALRGRAFNVGGGTANTISQLELLKVVELLARHAPRLESTEWDPCEPRYFVADTRRFGFAAGWRPRVDVGTGLARLYDWFARELHDAQTPGVALPPTQAIA